MLTLRLIALSSVMRTLDEPPYDLLGIVSLGRIGSSRCLKAATVGVEIFEESGEGDEYCGKSVSTQ